MLKYIRNFLVVFLIPVAFSFAYAAQVNINSADAATLAQSINGIGPSKAQAIVDYRDANGPFATLDDLVRVQGIGFKTLDRIRDFVTVESGVAAKPSLTPTAKSNPATSAETKPVLLPN